MLFLHIMPVDGCTLDLNRVDLRNVSVEHSLMQLNIMSIMHGLVALCGVMCCMEQYIQLACLLAC